MLYNSENSPLYLVGGYDSNGKFSVWNSQYSGGVFNNLPDAEQCLKDAVTKSNHWVRQYRIYKIREGDLKPITSSCGIEDFDKLMGLVKLSGHDWMTDDALVSINIWYNWKYSKTKRIVTIEFCYDFPTYKFREYLDSERQQKYKEALEKIHKDLSNQVKFVWASKFQKVLDDNNIDLKVEFKNKHTGTKLHKGFITKKPKEATNE